MHIARRDDPESVRTVVEGGLRHYQIGVPAISDGYTRGFGGANFTVLFNDGRVVKTNNLWYQGDIPKAWQDSLPANATIKAGWE
jgi:hypothetical protein